MLQRQLNRLRHYWPALAVFVTGVALSGAAGFWLIDEARRVDAERFDAAVRRVTDTLDERSERYVLELERFADMLRSEAEVTPEKWRDSIDRLSPVGNLPALVEVGLFVNPGLLSLSEVEERAALAKKKGAHHVLRPMYPPTLQASHHWRFRSAIGAKETEEWLKDQKVTYHWWGTANGKMESSPRRLIPGTNSATTPAVSFFFPIFEHDLLDLTSRYPHIGYKHFRDYRFKGIVAATIDWPRFVETALAGEAARIGFEAFGSTNVATETWMGRPGGERSRALNPSFQARFKKTVDWPFFRWPWKLVFYSTRLFDELSTRDRGYFAIAGGSSLSLLMAALFCVQIRARRRQELIAAQLRRAVEELRAARQERERLSHDLHDGTIQSLYGLQLGLSRSADLAREPLPHLGMRMEDHRRALTAVIGELRGFILRHEAEPGPAADLAGTIEALVQRLRLSTDKELRTDLSLEAALRLEGGRAVSLANLAREALSNSLRHANASLISIRLAEADGAIILEIADNGSGFDPNDTSRRGVGLKSMAARAAEAGASLEIDSQPGAGTRIRARVQIDD